MTTKERLHRLVDELSDDDAESALADLRAAARPGAHGPPQTVRAPESWGWDKTSWGAPMPNVVAWVKQSREGR